MQIVVKEIVMPMSVATPFHFIFIWFYYLSFDAFNIFKVNQS